MRYVWDGVRLIAGKPALWPYVWKPMALGAAVFAAVLCLAWFLVAPFIQGLVAGWGAPGWLGGVLAAGVYLAALFFFGGTIYLGLCGLLSAFLWDKLSLEVEKLVSERPPQARLSFWVLCGDAIPRCVFSGLVAVSAFACGWLTFGIAAMALAGWLGLYDYTSCAYLRRGITFRRQFGEAFRCRAWPGFAATSGIVTLIPLLNVLMLPALVAGGTLMLVDSESRPKGP
jgi:uncharacterized protein involved in cysteine biosynthesis